MHYNRNCFLHVIRAKIYGFRAKDSKITAHSLCSGNISKDFASNNLKSTGLNRYAYDFSVDYDSIDVSDIINIHKYLKLRYLVH